MINVSTIFQRWINQVFKEELIQEGISYIDDILMVKKIMDEYRERMRRILRKLAEIEMKTKLAKCEFEKKEIIFLRHHIGHNGIYSTIDKLATLKE